MYTHETAVALRRTGMSSCSYVQWVTLWTRQAHKTLPPDHTNPGLHHQCCQQRKSFSKKKYTDAENHRYDFHQEIKQDSVNVLIFREAAYSTCCTQIHCKCDSNCKLKLTQETQW